MSRIYVDEYDKVASIVRGDSPDECGLFQCQQRLFAWCSAVHVLKRQRKQERSDARAEITRLKKGLAEMQYKSGGFTVESSPPEMVIAFNAIWWMAHQILSEETD